MRSDQPPRPQKNILHVSNRSARQGVIKKTPKPKPKPNPVFAYSFVSCNENVVGRELFKNSKQHGNSCVNHTRT